jgi:hypothetical protein
MYDAIVVGARCGGAPTHTAVTSPSPKFVIWRVIGGQLLAR